MPQSPPKMTPGLLLNLTARARQARPDAPAPSVVLTGPPGIHVGPAPVEGFVVVLAYDEDGHLLADMTMANDMWAANAPNIALRFEEHSALRRRAHLHLTP